MLVTDKLVSLMETCLQCSHLQQSHKDLTIFQFSSVYKLREKLPQVIMDKNFSPRVWRVLSLSVSATMSFQQRDSVIHQQKT